MAGSGKSVRVTAVHSQARVWSTSVHWKQGSRVASEPALVLLTYHQGGTDTIESPVGGVGSDQAEHLFEGGREEG